MMSAKANERLKETLTMCHLGRTRRKKYEGRNQAIIFLKKNSLFLFLFLFVGLFSSELKRAKVEGKSVTLQL